MDKLPERDRIEDKFKWQLEDIYENNDLWEIDYKELSAKADEFLQYKGKLNENGTVLLAALDASAYINCKLEKMYVYAHMRRDEDNANPKYQDMLMRVEFLASDISAKMSFFEPEMLSVPALTLSTFCQQNESDSTDGNESSRLYTSLGSSGSTGTSGVPGVSGVSGVSGSAKSHANTIIAGISRNNIFFMFLSF